jgi:hypothetical protein
MDERSEIEAPPTFADVARLIGGDVEPLLELYAWVVGSERIRRDVTHIRQMYKAADTLSRLLPMYDWLRAKGMGRVEIDVAATVATMETIKADLAGMVDPREGRPVDARREMCAWVVMLAWKHVHGKIQGRSDRLYAACEAYWRACGGEIGDLSNWRHYVKMAQRQRTARK